MIETQTLQQSKIQEQTTLPSDNTNQIKPIGLKESTAIFGIFSLFVGFCYWLILPLFISWGIEPVKAFFALNIIPMSLLFVTSIALYQRENSGLRLRERFRYTNFSFKDIGQGLGLFFVLMIASGIMMTITAVIPAYNFGVTLDNLSGRYNLLALYLVVLFFNITGEEFLWRGYLLPRQQKAHGDRTWIIHGLQWNLFHIFKPWDLLNLLPVTLSISYIAHKTNRNWAAFMAHLLYNGLGLVLFVATVMG